MSITVLSGGAPHVMSEPLPWPSMAYYGGGAGCGCPLTYEAIYRSQPNVRTVVSYLATNVAQVAIHTYQRVTDFDRQRVRDHPVAVALENPWPGVTQYRLMEATVSDVAVYGQAFWLKIAYPGERDRLGLMRVPPVALINVDQPDQLGAPYVLTFAQKDGSQLKVRSDQLVWFRSYDPYNLTGSPPIEALRLLIAEDFEASQYRQQLWANGARIGGVLKRPADAPEWSDTAKQRFKAEWHAWYTGAGGADAGGTPLLEDGMEFVAGGFTAEQAQYLEARKLTMVAVAAAYHVPPPMVGVLDNANFANVREFHRSLYQDTLGPWFRMIEQELAQSVVAEYPGEGIYVEFNVAEKLRGSFEEQSSALQTAVGAPWMTRSEARARMNLPERPDADGLIVPLNVSATNPEGGAPAPEPGAASRHPLRHRPHVVPA